MAEKLELKIKGLYLSPNDYSSVPLGALLEAMNGVLDKESVFDSRRGQNFYSTTAFSSVPDQGLNFDDALLVHAGTVLKYDNDYTGVFTAYGTAVSNPADGYKIHSIQANKNLYFTTLAGIEKLDAIAGTIVPSGAPAGLDINGSLSGSSGFMADGTVVGYRMLWGYKDANGNLILGAPSQRFVILNESGGDRDIALEFTVPDDVTTAWFYQVYRTFQITPSTSDPGDEMFLCIEDNPSSGQISSKLVTVTDSTPDSILGVTLYTSPSQEGLQNSNYQPPFAKDIALYNNMALYANTKNKQTLFLTLIGAGTFPALSVESETGNTTIGSAIITTIGDTSDIRAGMHVSGVGIPATAKVLTVDSPTQITMTIVATANGITVALEFGDILTLAGTDYFASATETVASKKFKVSSSGTPAENIEDTSQSIVRVVNRYTGNTAIYAYYLSGVNNPPGEMAFKEREINGSTFYATSTAGSSFNPTLPISGTTIASQNDERQNAIYISKLSQPEAVPLYAFVFVGSANKPIRRILALRDSTFIFKDDGIFRLTGTDFQSIVVSLFDGSKKLAAYDSPAVFDNQIFCFVDQGIAAVSEQGVQIISKPIENQILRVSQFSNFQENTFGVGYDSDRKYLFWTVLTENDTYPRTAYIWNSITSTWTEWRLSRSFGIVRQGDNKLYMGNPVNDYVYRERKTLTYLDYVDESYDIDIAYASGLLLIVTDGTHVSVGDAIQQGTKIALVESINTTRWVPPQIDVYVNYTFDWQAPSSATVNKPFLVRCAFVPLDADNPSTVKHFPEATFFFKEANWTSILAGFSSNNAPEEQWELPPPENTSGDFGDGVYGSSPFGGLNLTQGRNAVRTYVPLEPSTGNWITSSLELNEPFANISFMGMSYLYNEYGTKLVS